MNSAASVFGISSRILKVESGERWAGTLCSGKDEPPRTLMAVQS